MMMKRKRRQAHCICPRTGKRIDRRGDRWWLIWLMPVAGLFAFVWFLIRVIPKPSRATYPCQRIAFPLASGFVTWLVGLLASAAAFRRAKASFLRSRYVAGSLFVVMSIACIWAAVSITADKRAVAADPHPVNSPIGAGRGIHPGRVVWVHDPNATEWAGPRLGDGYWWQDDHTDGRVVERMITDAVCNLAGESDLATAWDAVFRYFNRQRGRGDTGYQAGEKIMIKVNFVDMIATFGNSGYDLLNRTPDYAICSPHIMYVLLDQLVNIVGIAKSDISIGDPICLWCHEFYDMIYPDFPEVRYVDYLGLHGRTKISKSAVPLHWSTTKADGKNQDYVLNSYAEAAYLINLASFKGHYNQAGITLCGKNHYGSLRGPPQSGYYNMHSDTAFTNPQTGSYRNMVDMLGHEDLGGKTVLYMIDGLYAGKHAIGYPENLPKKWKMSPFNNDWPSSIFISQDGVAIDSVGFDFLVTEWPEANGPAHVAVDDYLHEAALANGPPSGTFYDPERDGIGMESLGVHEHWNNPIDKQYSGNLGIEGGIELVKLPCDRVPGDVTGDGSVDSGDLATMSSQWLDTIIYSETDGRVIIEAENYAACRAGAGGAQSILWRRTSDAEASQGQCVQALPDRSVVIDADVPASAPRLSFLVNFTTPGDYYLWLKGQGVDSESDSVYFGCDGVMLTPVDNPAVLARRAEQTLIAKQSDNWLYLDVGAEQSGWQQVAFDDAAWKAGQAPLGYGDSRNNTTIGYGDNSSDKYITAYFRKYFTVENPAVFSSLKAYLMRDDGGVIYLNGEEVDRSNMPGGPVDYNTIVRDHAAGGNEETTFFDYDADCSLLRKGENVVAVEIHQYAPSGQDYITSSDVTMDLELIGGTSFGWTSSSHDPTVPAVHIPSASIYTIDIWMCEDGAKLDRLCLTTDADYDPAASEGAESPRTPLYMITADLNNDGIVDLKDFALMVPHWNAD